VGGFFPVASFLMFVSDPAMALLLAYLYATPVHDGVPWEWLVTQHTVQLPSFGVGVREWHAARHMQPRQTHSHEHVSQTQGCFIIPSFEMSMNMLRRISRRSAAWSGHIPPRAGPTYVCSAHRSRQGSRLGNSASCLCI
jgi:hypothetical protein